MNLLRGAIYKANLESDESKLWLVVSPNARNMALGSALAVRLTTSQKYTELSSVVHIPDGELVHGWIRCDSLTIMYSDEPEEKIGALSKFAMSTVERGLMAALGISSK